MKIKEIVQSKKGAIIDVRNPGETATGIIPGAINIPVTEIPHRIDEIKNLNAPLVFYCQSGNRSSIAMMILKSAGVNTEMYNGGGYSDMLTFLN